MRKIAYLLAGVAALVALAVVITLFVVGYFTPVSSTTSTSQPTNNQQTAAQLPAGGMPSSGNYGMGGGGGREAAAYDMAMPVPTFADATFTLEATLPDTVPAATVWQLAQPDAWTQEEMNAIAAALGFDGTFYTEQLQGGVIMATSSLAEPAVMPAEGEAPVVAVDGMRRLTFYRGGFSYSDPSADPSRSGQPLLSYDQALPIAENFLRSAGLLNGEYQARRGWSTEVQFLRQVDGNWLERQFATVTVGGDGRISWADYSSLDTLQSTDSGLPTISAQRAYELLIANADMYGFNYYPSLEQLERERAQQGRATSFTRVYAPGQSAQLQTWLQILQPVNGGDALILADNMRVVGDAAMLAELAANGNQGVQLTGRFGGTPEALTFELESWSLNQMPMDQRLSGTLRRDGDRAILVVAGGLEIEIPGTPADLADGSNIAVYGWSISAAQNGGLPQFDWINIDTLMAIQPEPIEPSGPYNDGNLRITAVDLVVNSTYISDTLFARSEWSGEQFAHAWRFTVQNAAGDTLIFFVPAIEQTNG